MSVDLDALADFRARIHQRVCIEARSCTCPETYDETTLDEARDFAARLHAKFEHPGTPQNCTDPHDVLCKAVWP